MHDLRELHRRVAAEADRVIAAISPDQLDRPTPCSGWNVRGLLNHVVNGNLRFAAIFTGQPVMDRDAYVLGPDHLAAFRSSVATLTEAFSRAGALEGIHRTPAGDEVGSHLMTTLFNEMLVHTWDLAWATGQSTDINPELCELSMSFFEQRSIPRGEGQPFAQRKDAGTAASAADRLAAYAGRDVRG
jgi:uncharacterized protein (TIGR03086 family)